MYAYVVFRESMIFFFKKNPRFFQTIFKNACAVISYAKYLCRKYRTKYSIFAYPHEFLNKVFCFITGRFIMSVPVCRWHLRLDQLRFICRIEFYPDFYCQFVVPSMEAAGSAKTNQGKLHYKNLIKSSKYWN